MENNTNKIIIGVVVIIFVGLVWFGISKGGEVFGRFFGNKGEITKEIKTQMSKMIEENEPININNVKIMVNSVTKKYEECSKIFQKEDGSCSMTPDKPTGDYYLVADVSIENNSKKDFELTFTSVKLSTKDGEFGKIETSSSFIRSNLLNKVLAGEKLKGQVVFDIVESDEYYLFIEDFFNNFSSRAKISINSSDITE